MNIVHKMAMGILRKIPKCHNLKGNNMMHWWRRFLWLWRNTPADCRLALLGELLFSPEALRTRYDREVQFQKELDKRWIRK